MAPEIKTVTEYAVYNAIGLVTKEKVAPPFELEGVIDAELDEEIVKSEARPVVGPEALETAIMQVTGLPDRAG